MPELPAIRSVSSPQPAERLGAYHRVAAPALGTIRPVLTYGSHGTVFSMPASPAYYREGRILPSHEMACVLISECAGAFGATLYFDTLPSFLEEPMIKGGITVIDILKMDVSQMDAVLLHAKENKVKLDFHAPWLSKTSAGKFHYPTPATHPEIFNKLTCLAREYQRILGAKAQITIHMSGEADDWKPWVAKTTGVAQVIVENAFTMKLSDDELAQRKLKNDFEYFLHSDFHSPEELIAWVKELGLSVCFDQAHAFGGYRHANAGIFDPIGDLKYLKTLIDEGVTVARLHRASVPRLLAGRERGSLLLNQIDAHGELTAFTRAWFLANYPQETPIIERVFDHLEAAKKQGELEVTFEVLPAKTAESNFETI